VDADAPSLEVVDPTLREMIKRFPDHAVNGEYVVHRTRAGGKVRDPSFLVTIPRPKGNGYYDYDDGASEPVPLAGSPAGTTPGAAAYPAAGPAGPVGNRQAGAQGLPPQGVQPTPPPTPGVGRLRRVGDN
jgi:hypothetical protein